MATETPFRTAREQFWSDHPIIAIIAVGGVFATLPFAAISVWAMSELRWGNPADPSTGWLIVSILALFGLYITALRSVGLGDMVRSRRRTLTYGDALAMFAAASIGAGVAVGTASMPDERRMFLTLVAALATLIVVTFVVGRIGNSR